MTAVASGYANRRESLDDVIKRVADRSTPFMSRFLDLSNPFDNYKFEWSDKVLNGFKDTLAASITSTTQTIITLSGGTNNPKAIKDGVTLLLLTQADGVDELALVSSTISVASNYRKIVIARGERSTTAVTLANASTVKIVGAPREEGFDASRDDSQKGPRLYNFTQIFDRELKLSRTSQAIKVAGNESKMAQQIAEQMPELMKEIEMAFINNIVRSETGDVRISMGLRGACTTTTFGATSANNVNQNGAALNKHFLESQFETISNAGGDLRRLFMAVSHTQQRQINLLKEDRVLMNQSEKKLDNFVNSYAYGTDANIEIFYSNDLDAGEIYIGNLDNIQITPLVGGKLFRQELAVTGDNKREMLVGEYGFKFRNVPQTLYRHYGLATA
jgi:hypothetical protein